MQARATQYMKRAFFINVVLLLFVNLLIKPFYIFGIERTIQNRVEAGEYGLYFTLFNFSLLFQIVTDLGLQYFNNRHVAQHRVLFSKYFPHFLVLKGLLGLLYLLLLLVGAALWKYEIAILPLLLGIALNQVLSSLVLFLRSNVSGLGWYRTDSFLSVLDRLLLILICGMLLWRLPHFKIEWFVYAQTASLASTVLIIFWLLRRHAPWRFRLQPKMWQLLLKKSMPYALAVFLMTAYTRLDGVLLERLLPNGRLAADVYAAAYRLLDAGSMIAYLFAGLLLPMYARVLKRQQPVAPLLQFSLQLIWAGAAALAASVFSFQEAIMVGLYAIGDAYAGQVLGMLMLALLGVCCMYIYGPLLTANGNLRAMNSILIIGIILNITLNLLLIPRHGALGAATSACLTQAIIAIGKAWLAHRLLAIPVDIRFVVKIIAYAIICFTIGYVLSQHVSGRWQIRFVACGAACISAAFALQLIHPRSIWALLHAREGQ